MRLYSVTGLLVLLCLLQSTCFAQPADIMKLRSSVQEKQAKKDFQHDTAYINALTSLTYAFYASCRCLKTKS